MSRTIKQRLKEHQARLDKLESRLSNLKRALERMKHLIALQLDADDIPDLPPSRGGTEEG